VAQPTTAKDALSVTGKVSNPAPLGLAAFGVTTVVLSTINAGWLPAEAAPAVVPLAFSFGGLAQFIAGFLEYGNGNTFGMVAFTSYGAFWWWYALLNWTVGAGWIKAPDPTGVGVALLMWGVFTFYMWIPTFRTSFTLWSIFLLLCITFLLLAGGDLGMGAAWHKAGGWFGVITGIDALYLSFAEVTNATFGRPVIAIGGAILKS
jgi:succinate-acetate transporter protein